MTYHGTRGGCFYWYSPLSYSASNGTISFTDTSKFVNGLCGDTDDSFSFELVPIPYQVTSNVLKFHRDYNDGLCPAGNHVIEVFARQDP